MAAGDMVMTNRNIVINRSYTAGSNDTKYTETYKYIKTNASGSDLANAIKAINSLSLGNMLSKSINDEYSIDLTE